MNKGHYRITIQCEDDCNPEYELPDGDCSFDCDSYIILAMDEGKLTTESIMGVNVEDLSEILMKKHSSSYVIRSASALAEGKLRAFEIGKQAKAMEVREDLMRILRDMGE